MGHFKLLYLFFKQNKLLVFLYILFTLLSYPLQSVVIPHIYSNFFNAITKNKNKSTFIKYITLLIIIFAITNGSNYLTTYYESFIFPKLNNFVLDYLYKNLLIKYENNYEELELGKIINRLIFIPNNLKSIISEFCKIAFPRGMTMVVINIYFFYINWKLGLVSIFMLIIIFIFNLYFLNKCSDISKIRHNEYDNQNQYIQDRLSNLTSIYAFGNINFEISSFKDILKKYYLLFKNDLKCMLNSTMITSILMVILFIALNGFSAYLYFKKDISYVTLISVFIMVIYYYPCITEINDSLPEFMQYYGSIKQLDNFVSDLCNVNDNNEKITYLENKKLCKMDYAEINIKNLNFKYPLTNKFLFNNFNLKINHFDKIAITGPSGNGKSTLIKLIMGYYEVPNNTIFIDNYDINSYNLSDLRKKISYVNQNTKLFNKSVLENIQYGNNMTRKDVIKLCKKIGIEKIFENLDDGLDTMVGVNGDKLSGGQRQMINILRCIGLKNKIVILDEPTSAIDTVNTSAVIKGLEEISKDCTLILITHDSDILHLANRIIELNNGVIIKDFIENKTEEF